MSNLCFRLVLEHTLTHCSLSGTQSTNAVPSTLALQDCNYAFSRDLVVKVSDTYMGDWTMCRGLLERCNPARRWSDVRTT